LPHTISLLALPPALNAFLRDLPETWTFRNEGENTWSAFDVIAFLFILHLLIQSVYIRSRIAARNRASSRKLHGVWHSTPPPVNPLRAGFRDRRACTAVAQIEHPALGVVTLRELLATWAAHDLTHLHQIARVMAHQYREAVGPWSAYLGVLQCAGHSSP